ncbi:SusC/RagA family TonB-linked outer membrane protein [Niastella caeni]|nr:TonB-dependent receptor [Niastella caeni]
MEKKKLLCKMGALMSLLFMSLSALSQSKVVSGKITGAENQPLPNVSVQIKGTTKGTQSDLNGLYRIEVPSASSVLVFSAVGFARQELPVGSGTTLDVTMQLSSSSLEGVVVVGYGTQKRKEVTAAVATVKSEDFNQGGVRSPLDLIQGKVAGLSLTRTNGNNPNSGVSIQLRGVTSLTGSIAPLIVIDGIPGGNLDLLQMDDIESFDVLKDGSAAAIYGTRANGGVIIITTKKGKAGDPRYEYNTYVQRELIDKKPEILSPEEYIEMPKAVDLNDRTDIYAMLIDKQNISQYHNFSASGGTAKSNYRASLYFRDANGIAIRNTKREYGGRLNINQRGLQDKLTLQVNLAANFNKADLLGGSSGDFEQAVQRNPTAPVFNQDGTYLETNAFNNYNPIARLHQELSEREQQTFSGDARLTLEIIKGLKVSAFGAMVRDGWNDRQYRLKASRSSMQSYNGGGYAYKGNQQDMSRTFETIAEYSRAVAVDHVMGLIGGYSYQYNSVETFSVSNNGFLTDVFQDWNMGNGTAIRNTLLPAPGISSFKEDNTLIAFFGRLNYAFRGKYLAQFILRREGSSRFGANNKWGNFPAVSAGWVISDESFMKDIRQIDNLKLRIGYGVTGNQGIPNYQSLVTLSTGGNYIQNGVWMQTFGPSRNPNPDLRWEKKKELNVGIDFALLNNRLGGAIDLYSRKTEDLLYSYNAPQPPYILTTLYTNVGSISNKGIELTLSAVPIRNNNFSWNVDATWNYQKNKMSSLSNQFYKVDRLEFGGLPSPGNLGNAIRVFEGGPIGDFWGYRFAGFDDQGKWIFYKKDGAKAGAGAMSDDDRVVIGNGIPKYMVSLTNQFKYKNFDLTLFFRGKLGYDLLNTKEMYFGNINWSPNNMLRTVLSKHAQLNESPQYSNYYLEPGGFIKLDNVTLGYTVKLKTSYIRNLYLYVTGRNLITFTRYNGLDPELEDTGFTTGIDNRGFYPRTKSLAAGLRVGF